jgi:hypothetical protein
VGAQKYGLWPSVSDGNMSVGGNESSCLLAFFNLVCSCRASVAQHSLFSLSGSICSPNVTAVCRLGGHQFAAAQQY